MRFALIFSAGARPYEIDAVKIKISLILKIDKSIRDLIDDRCKKRFQQLAEQAWLGRNYH